MGHFRDVALESHAEDVAIRHDLHRHPELGYEEFRTAAAVADCLLDFGVEHVTGLAGGTGILAHLPSTVAPDQARTIALRADMDALPIVEETGLAYASEHAGRMHACGHDGHTTILIATARALSRVGERPNNVLFLFQPAEEGGAGGRKMCEEGALRGKVLGEKADVIYGLHGNPWNELGGVTTRVGPLMASASEFRIAIHGKGSHAAYPHLGVDPVLVAVHVITALQSVVSRSVSPLDPVVVTVGELKAGSAHNVIPEAAHLHGTLRTLKDATCEFAKQRIVDIATQVASALGASAEVKFLGSYPVTYNHADATETFRRVAVKTLGESWVAEEPEPSMGAEDFSFYGREVPACFFFLGLQKPGAIPVANLHSPRFNFVDEAIPTGVELFCELALAG